MKRRDRQTERQKDKKKMIYAQLSTIQNTFLHKAQAKHEDINSASPAERCICSNVKILNQLRKKKLKIKKVKYLSITLTDSAPL